MSDNVESVEEQDAENPKAVLFELENSAVNGREIVFGVVQKVMKGRGIDVKPFTYSRYALNKSLLKFVNTMVDLENKELPADEVVAEISDGIKDGMMSGSTVTNEALKKIIKALAEKDVSIGTLTSLDEDVAQSLLDKVDMPEVKDNLLCSRLDNRPHLSADAWLKLAKNMSVHPSACLAIATCKTSCKAALTAGMRCVVVPDKFTAFQDFGGADYVVDELKSDIVDSILELLEA